MFIVLVYAIYDDYLAKGFHQLLGFGTEGYKACVVEGSGSNLEVEWAV
jgi:hypothetical protein